MIHSGLKPFSCTHCDKSFSDKAHLTRHERLHNGVKPFSCKTCMKLFADKSHCLKHERNCKPIVENEEEEECVKEESVEILKTHEIRWLIFSRIGAQL